MYDIECIPHRKMESTHISVILLGNNTCIQVVQYQIVLQLLLCKLLGVYYLLKA